MKRCYKYLDLVFNKLTKKDWDNVIAIVADEGYGKSNLGLHFAEYWYGKLNGGCTPEDIKHICLSKEQFVEDLKDCVKYEMTIYDEAGDILSRRALGSFNVSIMKAYQVIRGDNLFTILVLPSLWDLDTFFRKRRLRGMFYVYKRGRVAFWDKDRLRKMVAINSRRVIPSYWVTKPLFFDTFPKYNGVLKEAYDDKKAEKMKGVRQQLFDDLAKGEIDPFAKRNDMILKMISMHGIKKTSELVGLSSRQIQRLSNKTPTEDSKPLTNTTLNREAKKGESEG